MTAITIAIDAMGGDVGPPITVPGSLRALQKHKDLRLILVGNEAVLREALKSKTYDAERLSIQHASQQVEMNEAVALALRNKKDSSMRVSINLVKDGLANACVSAGNTGALMATARFVLKTLPGIDRPAIISSFPTSNPDKKVRMLDLGANVDCQAMHLVQFAVMSSVLASAVDGIQRPAVALLNIGEEEIKGNELVKQTAAYLLELDAINYAGYIEGDAVYKGDIDIVVCDGFVGNVALKTAEGIARLIAKLMKEVFMETFLTKLLGVLVRPVLKRLGKRIDPAKYNGATLLGLQGTVIKSHGSASVDAFARAIDEAIMQAEKNIPDLIKNEVEQVLKSIIPKENE